MHLNPVYQQVSTISSNYHCIVGEARHESKSEVMGAKSKQRSGTGFETNTVKLRQQTPSPAGRLAWMQEVGGKMLLHFPHSLLPCSLATQEQLPRGSG